MQKVRQFYHSSENLGGAAPQADAIYMLVKRKDTFLKHIAAIDKLMKECYTVETDPRSENGLKVVVSDNQKLNSLQTEKSMYSASIQKFDKQLDAIDTLLAKEKGIRDPSPAHMIERAKYLRLLIRDKQMEFFSRQTGMQLPVPPEIQKQIDEFEAEASRLEGIAEQVTKLAEH